MIIYILIIKNYILLIYINFILFGMMMVIYYYLAIIIAVPIVITCCICILIIYCCCCCPCCITRFKSNENKNKHTTGESVKIESNTFIPNNLVPSSQNVVYNIQQQE